MTQALSESEERLTVRIVVAPNMLRCDVKDILAVTMAAYRCYSVPGMYHFRGT